MVKLKPAYQSDMIDSPVSPLLSHYLLSYKMEQRDKNPEQWLIKRSTTPTEYNAYMKQTIEHPDVRSRYFFTRWSNELIDKDVASEMRQIYTEFAIYERLKSMGGMYTGSFNALTLDETIFIYQAVVLFNNITEIYAVNELGYTDIWLVYSEFDENESLKRIGNCREVINRYSLRDISYLILHPGNFTEDVSNPLLHITMSGGS